MKILLIIAICLVAICLVNMQDQAMAVSTETFTATPQPTGTATPERNIKTRIYGVTRSAMDAVTPQPTVRPAPPTLYFTKTGKATNPCTKKLPCDIGTGMAKTCKDKRVWAQNLIFPDLTKEEVTRLSRDTCD